MNPWRFIANEHDSRQRIAVGKVAFTYIPTGQDGRPDAGPWKNLVLWLLKNSGEPWFWGAHPEELGHFPELSGWAIAPELVGESAKQGVELYAVVIKSS